MKRAIPVLLIVLITSLCTAQDYNYNRWTQDFSNGSTLGFTDLASEAGYGSKIFIQKDPVVGSPYINEEYLPVRIKFFENRIYYCRYNASNDQMEVKLAEDNIIALNNSQMFELEFTRSGKMYRTYAYTDTNNSAHRGFLVVSHENDDFTLLKREEINYYAGVEGTTSYNSNTPAKYRRKADVYYLLMGEKITPFPNRKGALLNAYEKDKKQIKKFLKEERIDLKNEADLIKTVAFVVSLDTHEE